MYPKQLNSKDLITKISNAISLVYEQPEAKEIAFLAIEHLFNLSKTDILLDKALSISEKENYLIESTIERLLKNEPIQYIIGETWFLGRKFKVDNSVLIPRPETEEIVNEIIAEHKTKEHLHIADFCTGSGCIAISLEQELKNSEVYAYELSVDALNTAQENAFLNNSKVIFKQQDVFLDFEMPQFDIIVSNPPYVCESEKAEMRTNVLDFEPHLALFVPNNNSLIFYERIASIAKSNLKNGGKVYFEINQKLGDGVLEILNRLEFNNCRLKKDFRGNDRLVFGEKGQ
jgi:release factor glutamine methyltransferase